MTPDLEPGAPRRDPAGRGDRRPAGPAGTPSASAFAGFGIQFVAALLIFLYAGKWVDRQLGTAPLFLVLGVFLGAGASFYSMYRGLTAAQRRAREEKERQGR
jgi:F0F1-type ATP synthase assembly protein I